MLFIHQPRIRGSIVYFLALLMFVFSAGCFHEFYKVQNTSLKNFRATVQTGTIQRADYYVLHHQGVAMHLVDPYFQEGSLHGNLSALPPYRNRNPKDYQKPTRYRPTEKYILEEVHIFINDDAEFPLEIGSYFVPDWAITEVHVYDKDKQATSASYAASILGLSIPLVITGAAIAESRERPPSFQMTTSSHYQSASCPFVYAHDGKTFRLQGEVFAGAIFPQLERHDYLPLPDITPVDHGYQIRLTNEQNEFHHINLTSLVVVEHPKNSTVLLDQTGRPHTIVAPQRPITALAPDGKDLLPLMTAKDELAYYYEAGELLQNYVDLRFQKPQASREMKLVLNARSSYWSTMMFGAMTEMLGDNYTQWAAQMADIPAENVRRMMDDQGLRLGIYLWENDQWQLVNRIENVGPIAFRDLVVPIDLSTHRGDEVRLKVEGGHLFWELDYAAADFSPNPSEVQISEYQPGYAIASDQQVYTGTLARDDDQYLEQPSGGHQVSIWYPAQPARAGFTQSVFLHSKGHYEHLRDYRGTPDMANFPQLDQAGSFIQFSKDQFELYQAQRSWLK
ncbi:hypothetical protein [Flavilitoribacter nigricans]|uniref:Uncharacterized protein n=1 Tax=Flavilitoribacter nigricans (strain ATCC 23147 / DSM 23189 / NBRC 102662 / NCIMB 1420 / SS-2) TaxID=1122177 RepID=A0A2D0NG99_FLAN2|nr:hypothetical protein [Flavilitoribacter nigricans]PHN07406.1 hypothetical protein CRP01_07190 [Flavilitoribacter nigricans DSM 23189 = NBRC 102662]